MQVRPILHLWEQCRRVNEEAVLATVVRTAGSSYRLPGARLLIAPSGEHAGSISGGCLEDDLLRRAWWLSQDGPTLRRYDTTDEEESGAYGLGCNGTIDILLERLVPGRTNALDILRQVRADRQPVTITHVLAPDKEVGTVEGAGRPACNDVWIEQLLPPIHLLLCGAGDDAIPLHKAASTLDWQISVFDGRAHYARPERFPEASSVTVVAKENLLAFPHDPWTVAALMTHSYSQDAAFLRALLPLNLPYLGILGPRKRTERLLSEMEPAGLANQPNIYSPMGLDIGADGPEQVALSVLAEMQAALNSREGGQLRRRNGSIHAGETLNTAHEPAIVCV